jgi:hypothetical protein
MARRNDGSCFMIGVGMLLLGGVLGAGSGAYLATSQCTKGCEADLGICKMGRETRQKALETATQELNQCQQQLKRMR